MDSSDFLLLRKTIRDAESMQEYKNDDLLYKSSIARENSYMKEGVDIWESH